MALHQDSKTGLKAFSPPDSFFIDLDAEVEQQTYRIFVGGRNVASNNSSPRDLFIVVDGNWLFASLTEYLRTLSLFDASVGWPIVAAVGYPTDDDGEILALRTADLSLDNSTDGAEALSKFIERTATPFLENDLHINVKRKYLAGHSWGGGSFALYNMWRQGSDYDGYLEAVP